MKNIKITYKSTDINVEFENALRKFMKQHGFESWASGYDLTTGVRDIAYERQDDEEHN